MTDGRTALSPNSYSDHRTRENLTFITLIEGICRRQKSALKTLHDCTSPRIQATAFRFLRSKQDAEEIVCDVLFYVWEHAQQYSRERGSVMTWLILMTRCRAIDRMRQRKHCFSIDDDPPHGWQTSSVVDLQSPEDVLAQMEEREEVRTAMASLSPLRRTLVELAFFRELTHQDIADILAMPHGTVKSHVRRGLIAMRTAMTRGCASSGV